MIRITIYIDDTWYILGTAVGAFFWISFVLMMFPLASLVSVDKGTTVALHAIEAARPSGIRKRTTPSALTESQIK
jgi:hypothetical protein